MQADGEEHPHGTLGAEPLLASLLLLPRRAVFVAVAVVQITVEMAIATRGTPSGARLTRETTQGEGRMFDHAIGAIRTGSNPRRCDPDANGAGGP